MRGNLGGPPCVSPRLSSVLPAVQLDCHLALWAGKIDDAPPDRMLTAQLPRQRGSTQRLPETPLHACRVTPQPARGDNAMIQRHCRVTPTSP
jgi:hypothetical protein